MPLLAMTCAAVLGLSPVAHASPSSPLPARPFIVPVQAPAPLALIELNTAAKPQLESLPGVDGSMADAIIAGRPYAHPSELVQRKIVPPAIYERIKDRLMADGQRP